MRFLLNPLTRCSAATLVTLGGIAGGALLATQAQAHSTLLAQATAEPNITPVQPGSLSSTSLSMAGARQRIAAAEAAIANQDFATAITQLETASNTLNQLSLDYQALSEMFVGVNTQLNRSHREQALEAAQMRDQAKYQLALIYRAQNQPDQSIPLLMEILRSQQPTRPLGQQAYQQLFELGFVTEPYAGPATAAPGAD